MWLITDWMVHSWELLQIRGWWFAVGLILCIIVTFLPLKAEKNQKNSIPFWPVVWGALLPMCNFAAIPIAAVLLMRGAGVGAVLAFLSAAVLLNPAGVLYAWAYMGPALTIAYVLSAVMTALMAGFAGRNLPGQKIAESNVSFAAYLDFGADVAFWAVLGLLAEAVLLTLMPAGLWQNTVLNPQDVSFFQMGMAAIFRHVCIPDDVSLIASLAASGLRPGCAVLFLLMGVCTNLPELFVLYGMAGKKTAVMYALTTVILSVAASALTELLIGPGFVPQFDLTNAGLYSQLANLLSVRTWMPAKIPCALGLLLLAGRGLWNRRK